MRRPKHPLRALHCVDAAPFGQLDVDRIQHETERKGTGDLAKLLHASDTWQVRENSTIA
jgi:hypothetical protein